MKALLEALQSLFDAIVNAIDLIVNPMQKTSTDVDSRPSPSGSIGAGQRSVAPVDSPRSGPAPLETSLLNHPVPASLDKVFDYVNIRSGIDYTILAKIAFVESSFKPTAINRSDVPPSVGLMGVKTSTAQATMGWTSKTQNEIIELLFDPYVNVDVAARVLAGIAKRRPEARANLAVWIGMYHLGEPRYLATQMTGPQDSPEKAQRVAMDRTRLTQYLSRFERA